MVSKTDDVPATVPTCNPDGVAHEPNGNQDIKESIKATMKDPCACGKVTLGRVSVDS